MLRGKSFEDGFHHGLLLPFVIAELTLVGWANVQLAMIPLYSHVGVVDVSVYQVADFYGL